MIKYYLIIGLIAALLPASTSSVSASVSAERGLFSFISSSNDNSLTITGNGNNAEMQLKATRENGKTNRVSDFRLTSDNVLFIEQNDKVTITDNVDFTRALVTDSKDNEKRIDITSNGVMDFVGYAQGVYTLDVVVDDRRAFEAIIVIGDQDEQVVNKEVTRVNNKQITEIWIEIIFEIDCSQGYHLDEYGFCIPDEPSVCYFDPNDPACDPIDGKCPDGFGFNEDDRCIPQGKCPDGYVRADDDETGTCFEKGKDDRIKECADGSIRLVGDTCYYSPKPGEGCAEGYELTDYGECREIEPIDECEPGYTLVNGHCSVCEYYDPDAGICEPMPYLKDNTVITPTPTPSPTPTPTPPTPTPPVDPLSTTPSPSPLARGLLLATPTPTPEAPDNPCEAIPEPDIPECRDLPAETPEPTPLPPTPDSLLDSSTEDIEETSNVPLKDTEEESEDTKETETVDDEPDDEEPQEDKDENEEDTGPSD
jgi:hypothetical protein